MSPISIIAGGLREPQVIALLEQHLLDMYATSPAESVHALDLEQLATADMHFWSAWQDRQLLGCVALKVHSQQLGEIKSMRTATAARGRGVASALLQQLQQHAQQLGLQRLCLETGSMDFFIPARTLYAKCGFLLCEPFANYQADPNSIFMEKTL